MAKVAIPPKPEEYSKSKSASKHVYFFRDVEYNIDQISKEVFLKTDKEVHYPTPFRGKDKYPKIKKFVYIGFNKKLPVGVYKVHTFGYGFTKTLRPLSDFLTTLPISEIVVERGGPIAMDLSKGILYLSETFLSTLNTAFSSLSDKQKEERERTAQFHLNNFFPLQVASPDRKYSSGSLAATLLDWGNAMSEFSDADKVAIKDLFDKLTLLPNFFSETNLAKTKEIIDNKFVQAALDEFDVLSAIQSDTAGLEKKWQAFLKRHSWIFSTLFAQPVILHKDEAYVGGKSHDNTNGKYNDFLIRSGLSNNVSFVEIKTHLTAIVDPKPYRGNDVFPMTKELTGSISQVLNQRDTFQKEYYTLTKKSDLETFNSKTTVIIGTYSGLSVQQKGAFELFRSNSKDVEILAFDELRAKVESLLKIITGK